MSNSKVYVGNLSYNTSQEDLDRVFGAFGGIDELKLIIDRDTGRSKGFAFITFSAQEAADQALTLNDTELDGRRIRVNIARENGGGNGGRGRPGQRRNQYGDR